MKQSKSIIAQELGRLGGLKTLKNKGKKHFKEMAKKRWKGVDKHHLTKKDASGRIKKGRDSNLITNN